MPKRHFLQQAQTFSATKHNPRLWWFSEKYDGMRAFWDGGVSRGKLVRDVPWANILKDTKDIRATGLWSRYGKSIQAPDYFLDRLPAFPLDGELWAGRKNFQQAMSICRKHIPVEDEWKNITYMVFDSPALISIFYPSVINQGIYMKDLHGCLDWLRGQKATLAHVDPMTPYRAVYLWLKQTLPTYDSLRYVVQTAVRNTEQAEELIRDILLGGGEGFILRDPEAIYRPERSWALLKGKPSLDAEAEVIGYVTGRATSKGSKLIGTMGAMIVSYRGKVFQLSGFTDIERTLTTSGGNDLLAYDWACDNPETECPETIHAKFFPRGSLITFTYRELSDDGIPKEARYLRPFTI